MGLRERLVEELFRYVPTSEATEGPHGVFRYPAKYLPQIARALVEELTDEGDHVLDPFAGSGTTLVEAVRRGRSATGVDLNPLAALLSRVKTTPLDAESFVSAGTCAEGRARAFTRARVPDFPNRDYWFPRSLSIPWPGFAVRSTMRSTTRFARRCSSRSSGS